MGRVGVKSKVMIGICIGDSITTAMTTFLVSGMIVKRLVIGVRFDLCCSWIVIVYSPGSRFVPALNSSFGFISAHTITHGLPFV